jgi:Sap, sulfolipid-1-addressing protein
MNLLTILPLAIVMIAGPQIISAVFLATSTAWARNSAAFLAGAALSITLFVTVLYVVMRLVKSGASSDKGTGSHVLDIVVLVLLVFLAVYVFLDRKRSEPPKWMGKLETATPRFSFTLGFLLLGIFPTDIATSAAVAARLARQGDPWWHAIPFILLTLLLLALPVLLVVLLGKRAHVFLPKVRDWMNTNSWIVSEIVIVFFAAITIHSLTS